MFCEKCGEKLEPQMIFCTACGAKVPQPEPVEETMLPLDSDNIQTEAVEVSLQSAEETLPELELEPESAPAQADTAPAEPEPVVIEPEPEILVPQTVVVEPAPAVPQPVAEQPAPIVPQPVVTPPAPAPAPTPKKEKRKKPHIVLRILLQFLSFVLCIVLAASLVATVVLADLNHLTSEGGIKQLVNAVLTPNSGPQRITPAIGAAGVHLDEASANPGFTIPNIDLDDIPEDLLNGGATEENISGLIDWIYEELQEASEEPLPITKEQVEEFVAESTVSEYVAEKLAGYADDFINGTENTTITTEEIMQLLEENTQLIEETFDVTVTEEVKQSLSKAVEKVVVENDLNTVIRVQVFETVEETIDKSVESMGMGWEDIQAMLQLISSDLVLYIAMGTCLVLMLLLCLLNFYNVPAGLTWIAVPSMLMGAILTAPLVVLKAAPELLSGLVPGNVLSIVASFANVLLPIHGAVLALGVGLLFISILWRIIRSAVRRKRRLAAAA